MLNNISAQNLISNKQASFGVRLNILPEEGRKFAKNYRILERQLPKVVPPEQLREIHLGHISLGELKVPIVTTTMKELLSVFNTMARAAKKLEKLEKNKSTGVKALAIAYEEGIMKVLGARKKSKGKEKQVLFFTADEAMARLREMFLN